MNDFIKNSLVFDVGANIGNKTAEYLNNNAAKVIAVEPTVNTYNILSNRFKNDNRVICENIAISKNNDTAILYNSNHDVLNTLSKNFIERTSSSQGGSNRFQGSEWKESSQVITKNLDYLIEKYGLPTYCKIDVEGHEFSVIQGLTKPIKHVSFEHHFEFIEESVQIMKYLLNLDSNYVFNFKHNDKQTTFEKSVSAQELEKYLRTNFNSIQDFGMIDAIILSPVIMKTKLITYATGPYKQHADRLHEFAKLHVLFDD